MHAHTASCELFAVCWPLRGTALIFVNGEVFIQDFEESEDFGS